MPPGDDEEEDDDDEEEERPPTLAEKLRLLFDALYPDVNDVNTDAGLGGRRAAALRGQLQPLRADARPGQAGGHHLSPSAAADPAVRRVRPGVPGRTRRRRNGRRTCATSRDKLTASCRAVDPASTD